MDYKSNSEKIKNYFFSNIYPYIDLYGVSYEKTIINLSNELSVSEKKVEEFIKSLIKLGKLKEIRQLELPQEELDKREKIKKEIEKEIKEEVII